MLIATKTLHMRTLAGSLSAKGAGADMEEEDELELKLPKMPKLTKGQLDALLVVFLVIIVFAVLALMHQEREGWRAWAICQQNLTICLNGCRAGVWFP